MPRKAIAWTAAGLTVLVLAGLVFSNAGQGSTAPKSDKTIPSSSSQLGPIPASLGALMGLETTPPEKAPGFSLLASRSGRATLSQYRGKVVVLTFFDSRCDDICTVLEHEMELADKYLAARHDAGRVELLTINSDPVATSLASARPAVMGPLATTVNWQFLTSSLKRLNALWVAYDVTIEVERSEGVISHNDVMYFIDRSGQLRAQATPVANQVGKKLFTLPAKTEASFARGVADEVESLLGRS